MITRELGLKASKELLYRIYEAVNDTFKPYKQITKKELIENIIIRYQDVNVLKNFILDYELDLIDQVYHNDFIKCTFIHRNLIDRFILIKEGNYVRINPDIVHVLEPILNSKVEKDECFKYDDYVLGLIYMLGYSSDDILYCYMDQDVVDYNEFMTYLSTSPNINYHCLKSDTDEYYHYNLYDNTQIIDDNKNNNIDFMFYSTTDEEVFSILKFGFNNTNPKINKMIEYIYQLDYEKQVELTDQLFLYAHLNKQFIFVDELLDKFNIQEKEIFKDAYLEMNSGSLYGTPIKENIKEEKVYVYNQTLLENKKQINAHLNEEEARLFYELYYSLLEYVNDKYKVCKHIDRILNQRIAILDIIEIRKCFIEHKEIIDEFIIECKDFFNEEEIEIIKGFKDFIYGYFMVVKFEEDYALFLKGNNFYGVIGTHINICDDILEYNLPSFANWMLLPYKGKIIWDGLIHTYHVPQDKESLREMIANKLEENEIIFEIKKYN